MNKCRPLALGVAVGVLWAFYVGGLAVIATFDLTGPESCSNLPVQRYSPDMLSERVEHLMPGLLTRVQSEHHKHRTPKGNIQTFQVSAYREKEIPT